MNLWGSYMSDQECIIRRLMGHAQLLWQDGQRIWGEYCAGDRKLPETAYLEYGIIGTLHRGYYCPSPIQDIVFGNNKRGPHGKIIREKWVSEWYYRYSFDSKQNLIKVESMGPGWDPIPEYLFRDGNAVWGIQVEGGRVRVVSKEVYQGNKIIQYSLITRLSATVCQIKQESYEYNDTGLSCASIRTLEVVYSNGQDSTIMFMDENENDTVVRKLLFQGEYHFKCENGFLKSYFSKTGYNDSFYKAKENEYPVLLRRKG